MTFAFATSDGHRGILQFFAANSRGIYRNALIRYKQLQQADTPALTRDDGHREFGFDIYNGGVAFTFLTHKSVQEDLKMTDLQIKKADATFQKHKEAEQHLRDLPGQPAISRKRAELSKEAYKAIKDILNADQQKRLRQISLQQRGVRALNNRTVGSKPIIEELGLSEHQQGEIEGLIVAANNRSREYSKEADRKFVEEIEKKLNAEALAVLTSEQKTRWREMIGPPFSGGKLIGRWRPRE